MTFTYTPHGVCSRQIVIDIDENTNTINSVSFTGGCNGNLQGIAALVICIYGEVIMSAF